jgi:hypothetical protein
MGPPGKSRLRRVASARTASNRREILLATLAVVAIYLARPLLVRSTMRGISPNWEDSSLASVMVPKGSPRLCSPAYPSGWGCQVEKQCRVLLTWWSCSASSQPRYWFLC